MDDIKWFSKHEKELEPLIQTVSICGQDKGRECGIKNLLHSNKRNRKRQMTNLPNQERIRTIGEKETWEILQTDMIKQGNIKEKTRGEYLKRTRKLRETKLCSTNLIKRINI